MMKRIVLSVWLCAALLFGQGMKMSVAQLKNVLRSSIKLQHQDKQVADYVKKVTMTEKLTERDIEEMLGEGLGPKAADAMRSLVQASASLPAPVKDGPVKPPPPPMPPPSSEVQAQVISEARELALSYTKRLPDFICLQVTRRYADPSGLEMYQLMDTVAARLSYFEQKEDYKLISVNGNLKQGNFDQLGGATSTGEFGTMLREIFEPETQAEFNWERWAKLRGKICHVYAFRVEQSRSKWHVSWQKQMEVVPAYRGLVYVDRDVPMVMRVTMEAENMPATFPIQEAKSMLDYDFTEISGNPFLLPLRSEMKMREGRILVKNQTEFRNYRKFGTETTITFDTNVDPIPEEKLKEEQIKDPKKKQ